MLLFSVSCQWGGWSVWSACSESCGTGSQSRFRSPSLAASCNGSPCSGSSSELNSCNEQCCPGKNSFYFLISNRFYFSLECGQNNIILTFWFYFLVLFSKLRWHDKNSKIVSIFNKYIIFLVTVCFFRFNAIFGTKRFCDLNICVIQL